VRRTLWALTVAGVSLQLACGGGASVSPPGTSAGGAAPGERAINRFREPPAELLPELDDVALHERDILAFGPADAPTIVLVYTDWKCPHCEAAWPRMQALAGARDDVQVRYRSFPLSGPCNDTLEVRDESRCTLAKAALCANEEGGFVDFAPAAYALPDAVLAQSAWSGVSMTACMADAAMDEVLQDHIRLGQDLELSGTPTFFLRRAGQWFGPLNVEQVVNELGG